MICLKSLTFVVSITTTDQSALSSTRCDLLEKSYLCGINNNITLRRVLTLSVVICLKSLTFVVSITTHIKDRVITLGCDLLEKSYLCGINNNVITLAVVTICVVICLKSLTFVVSITTTASFQSPLPEL